mmetsp:Transcript_19594/g.55111  ORF Transcript_19594/g.55111 Transcript_19594/m.55111 type:complete len:200 (-) Transcript_19594:824-1423(-)
MRADSSNGRVPTKSFSLKSSVESRAFCPSEAGIVPSRKFPFRFNTANKADRLTAASDRVPESELNDRLSSSSVSLKTPSGTNSKWLLSPSRIAKAVFPRSGGRRPPKSLSDMVRMRSFDNRPISLGMVPNRLLLSTFTVVNADSAPMRLDRVLPNSFSSTARTVRLVIPHTASNGPLRRLCPKYSVCRLESRPMQLGSD